MRLQSAKYCQKMASEWSQRIRTIHPTKKKHELKHTSIFHGPLEIVLFTNEFAFETNGSKKKVCAQQQAKERHTTAYQTVIHSAGNTGVFSTLVCNAGTDYILTIEKYHLISETHVLSGCWIFM